MRTEIVIAGVVACCDPSSLPTPTPTEAPTPTVERGEPASPIAPVIRMFEPAKMVSPDGGDVDYCLSIRDANTGSALLWEHWSVPNVGDISGTMTSAEWHGGEGVVCFSASMDLYGKSAKDVTFYVKITDPYGLSDTASAPWTITAAEEACPALDPSCSSSLGLPSDVIAPTPVEP